MHYSINVTLNYANLSIRLARIEIALINNVAPFNCNNFSRADPSGQLQQISTPNPASNTLIDADKILPKMFGCQPQKEGILRQVDFPFFHSFRSSFPFWGISWSLCVVTWGSSSVVVRYSWVRILALRSELPLFENLKISAASASAGNKQGMVIIGSLPLARVSIPSSVKSCECQPEDPDFWTILNNARQRPPVTP